MMAQQMRLQIGTKFIRDGETVTVIELHADCVVVKSVRGQKWRLAVPELLADPGTEFPGHELPGAVEQYALGAMLDNLDDRQRKELRDRLGHIREVLTGFKTGDPSTPFSGEPRDEYLQFKPLKDRCKAKATELAVSERTVMRWITAYRQAGPAGLVDGRVQPVGLKFRGLDPRWVDVCRIILSEHVDASKPSTMLILERVQARLTRDYGEGVVESPSRSVAYVAITELDRGRYGLRGSTKNKRSVHGRPAGTTGGLRATRPGEFVLLDTTPLNVYAMDHITLQWFRVDLTVAIDLYTRCIVGMTLSPVSTKSVDIATVLYDAITPRAVPDRWPSTARWPYHGMPETVVANGDFVQRPREEPVFVAGPTVAPETILIDHGKVYISSHVESVCKRLGVSIQLARPYTGSDKGPVERFFRSVETLLEALPGYKGPDVFSRGKDPLGETYFFIYELEAIIREWIADVYHNRPHRGLFVPQAPGLKMSPAAMFEHGIATVGFIQVPTSPDLALDFLPVQWRQIHHYGVELNRLRYNAGSLDEYRNLTSPHAGAHAGKWPFRYNAHDVRYIFFQASNTNQWIKIPWEHAREIDGPLGADALEHAKVLARAQHEYPNPRVALAVLLDRWNLGLAASPAERRAALRQARIDSENAPMDIALMAVPGTTIRVLGEPADADGPANAQEVNDADMVDDDIEFLDGRDAQTDADYYSDAYGVL